MKRFFYYFLLLICCSTLIIVTGCSDDEGNKILPPRQITVQEYINAFESVFNKQLAQRDNRIRKYVEESHVTVSVKSAKITKISANTKNGSNYAGNKGENISEVFMDITLYWDGMIHKDGYTTLSVCYDAASMRFKSYDITDTNAWVNINDPKFWVEVGTLIALCL